MKLCRRFAGLFLVLGVLFLTFAEFIPDAGAIGVIINPIASCQVVVNSGLSTLTSSGGQPLVYDTVTCTGVPGDTGTTTMGVGFKFRYGGYWYEQAAVSCGSTNPATGGYGACGAHGWTGSGSGGSIPTISWTFTGGSSCSFGTYSGCTTPPEYIAGSWWVMGAIGATTNTTNQGYAMEPTITGNGGSTFGYATFAASGSLVNACSLTAVSGDSSQPTSNGTTEYTYTLSYNEGSSQVDGIAVVDDATTSGTTETVFGKTFYVAGAQVDSVAVGSLQSPHSIKNVWPSGHTVNPHFWCHFGGSGGQWVDWGLLSAVVSGGSQYAGNTDNESPTPLAVCLDNAGWSLTNPSSWVIGALKDGQCILQWLFVPSQTTVSSLEDQFGVGSNAPTVGSSSASQWLGNIGSMLLVGPHDGAVAIQTCATYGCTAPAITSGMSVTANSHTYTVSIANAMTAVSSTASSSTWLPMIDALLAAFLLVIFFIEVVRWMRKILGSKE